MINQMNKFVNTQMSMDIRRSKFKKPFTHKTTMVSGDLVPIMIDEILPGETRKLNYAQVVRSLTPLVPVMDNAFIDIYAFFVPNRLATFGATDWQEVCGENVNGFWSNSNEQTLTSTGNVLPLGNLGNGSGKMSPRSVGAYLGLPINVDGSGKCNYLDMNSTTDFINSMPFYAYYRIWNEWFRDENLQAPIDITQNYLINNIGNPSGVMKVNKFHDYFTSALPSPQKGDSVLLPLGDSAPINMTGLVPVAPYGSLNSLSQVGDFSPTQLKLFTQKNSIANGIDSGASVNGLVATGSGSTGGTAITGTNLYIARKDGSSVNMEADLSEATSATINQIRLAFALQRMLEKDARGGSRYIEVLKSYYGIIIPEGVVQRSQYLNGKRIPLNMQQVLQTSETNAQSGYILGSTGAFSNTADSDFLFTKSFVEYGYLMVMACIRTSTSYSQGLNKMFTRNRRYDFYWPTFANIGEQPVYKREIFLDSDTINDNSVFGYQEAWAEYRFKAPQVSGYLAPYASDTLLTPWTYTNYFNGVPVLNEAFIKQSSSNISDSLAVSDTDYQFICDFYFDMTCTLPMPLFSVPGLIDHH